MKYKGRLVGRNLLTGRTDAENAHILAGLLQGDAPTVSKEVLFFSTCRKVFGGLYRAHSPTHPLWLAIRETGLIETLLQLLIKQEVRESPLMPREELDWCVSEAVACLSLVVFWEPGHGEHDVKAMIKQQLGAILEFISLEYGLKSKGEPEQLYEIQCLAVMIMGFLVFEFESDDSLNLWDLNSQSSMNVRQLASLALAVIFDPLAESNAIEIMTRDLAHRYARNILALVDRQRDVGCYPEIAPLVAHRYGAKRILPKCSSYFANPRYIARCGAGLRLCGAMAPAKAIQPRLINDAKLHLTIIRWYWKSFRGPQEVPPEDKEVGHKDQDLTELPADVLTVLWSITHFLSPELRKKLIYDSVVQGDLVMVIGHWFFIPQTIDPQIAACKLVVDEITKQYGEDRQFVAAHIEPTWRHVFKALDAAKRSGVQTWRGQGTKTWLLIGERLGLVPKDNDGVESSDSPIQSEPTFVKCNSITCPLYGEYASERLEPGISGLKCTQCQTVYCSLACQKT
ncbi:hypothetical protein FRC00_009567, partial [Tulasnella sp. 408]